MVIDVDWSRPRTACQTPGCDHPNFHVCTLGKPDLFPELLGVARSNSLKGRTLGPYSESRRNSIAEAQAERRAREKEQQIPRDRKMVARYSEPGVSMLTIQKEFKVSRNTVMKVLHEAAAKGDVIIRPKGRNIKAEA